MKIICVACEKRRKNYIGDMPDDTKSWVCSVCYNAAMVRVRNLRRTTDELNGKISKLRGELKDIPDVFKQFSGKNLGKFS